MKRPALILFFCLINYSILTACSCTRGARLVKKELERSTLVVVGTVISIKKVTSTIQWQKDKPLSSIDFYKVKLKVEQTFKGKKRQKYLTIYTGRGKGDCGFVFRKQQQYIVYTNKQASPFMRQGNSSKGFKSSLWTDICTRTQALNPVELAALNKL